MAVVPVLLCMGIQLHGETPESMALVGVLTLQGKRMPTQRCVSPKHRSGHCTHRKGKPQSATAGHPYALAAASQNALVHCRCALQATAGVALRSRKRFRSGTSAQQRHGTRSPTVGGATRL